MMNEIYKKNNEKMKTKKKEISLKSKMKKFSI